MDITIVFKISFRKVINDAALKHKGVRKEIRGIIKAKTRINDFNYKTDLGLTYLPKLSLKWSAILGKNKIYNDFFNIFRNIK